LETQYHRFYEFITCKKNRALDRCTFRSYNMEIFKSFSKDNRFWEQLLEDTNQFQEAALYLNALHLDQNYDAIFKRFFQKYNSEEGIQELAKIRVYVKGVEKEVALNQLKNNPPENEENLSDWGESLFEGKPWCIVLDKVSGLIDELSLPIAEWTQYLLSKRPPGSLVIEISPYIGRYGYTPFGAHIDVPGISVLHLHLGPNKKEMTIWDADEFRKLTKSDSHVCHDFEPFLSEGKTYSIEAGDIFHLPAGTHYHIGKADEFSIGLTIGLKKETSRSLLQKAMKEHQKSGQEANESDVVESYNLKKQSNAGFMKTPLLKVVADSELFGKKVKVNSPFQLILKGRNEGKLEVYVRGRSFTTPNYSEVISCIQLLNQGEAITLTEDYFKQEGMEKSKVMSLMTQLYNYRGIILV